MVKKSTTDGYVLQVGQSYLCFNSYKRHLRAWCGDRSIKNIARMLREDSGTRDIVARIGGEEFCILTPGGMRSEVIARFENLCRMIEENPVTILK